MCLWLVLVGQRGAHFQARYRQHFVSTVIHFQKLFDVFIFFFISLQNTEQQQDSRTEEWIVRGSDDTGKTVSIIFYFVTGTPSQLPAVSSQLSDTLLHENTITQRCVSGFTLEYDEVVILKGINEYTLLTALNTSQYI